MKTLAGLVTAAGLVFTVACGQTDAGITTIVKTRLAADDTVKAYQVDVDTSNKVVTLRGEVETVAQKEHAVMIARSTEGVRDVIDQLRVNPTAATTGIDDIGNDRDDVNVTRDIEAGARRVGEAAKEGAEKAGDAVKDVFTDDDKDTDRDGK